ncbi:uncharacterized protein [Leptinotarsa decemlineata]|uniref:uncharacterized protein n=1 Tax=Leptinotarsa decemlineata TaxID=7539 RepID=UPI000C254126|nr:zinc finger protein 345-like [Leptinotarsa decemlineata]
MNKCRAVGCCNLQGDVGIHFFRFPIDEKRCMQWKKFVEFVGDVPPEKCHKNMRLCHFHFDEKYFTSTRKNRLYKDAIPTIRSVDVPATSGNAYTSEDVKPLRQGELEEDSKICMIEESFDRENYMEPLAIKLELDEEAPNLEKAYKDEDEAVSNTDYSHSFDGGYGLFESGRQIKMEVKSEPSEAEMFSECERNGDASNTNMSTNDLDENDELKVNMPIDKFDPDEIKVEETCFIPYFDLKSEKCEKAIKEGSNLKACEEELFSHENGSSNSWRNHNESRAILLENITEDSKPSVGFTKDIGNILVETKEKTIFDEKEEIFIENIPSAPDEMKFVVEDDYVVKHEMEPTTERINEQYNSANLETSERSHSEEKPFQCKMCSKSFTKADVLKHHEKLHTGEKPFQCKICSKSFVRNNRLKIHTGEKPFQCKFCSKSFIQESNLKYHEKIHTAEKPFQCKICSKSFAKPSALKDHEKIHTKEKEFQCNICSMSFIRNSELIKHERTHSGEKPFQCQICSKSFSRSDNLKCHEKIHTGEKAFQCKICSKSFIQNSELIRHERTHSGEKPFHCQICSKSFSRSAHLKYHEKIHTEEKSFQCEICLKAFFHSHSLKRHEKNHTGEKSLKCKVCSKSFKHGSYLKYHEKIHTEEKPFQCKICLKSFIRNSELITHERTHSGEKPFQCQICSKSFSRSGDLKCHENIHTGEKPFQCRICSKSFVRNSDLIKHETTHSGAKPFQCKFCSKSFSRSDNLKCHENIHTGEKSFK